MKQFTDGRHIVYSPYSNAAIKESHLRSHRTAVSPVYHFDRAKLIVSFGADFLGTWVAPVQFTRDYTEGRNLRDGRGAMSRHIQFESRLSLTGSNADRRIKVSPAEEIAALLLLAKNISDKSYTSVRADFDSINLDNLSARLRQMVEQTADDLIKHRGESLVLCGSNDADAHLLANFINDALGNYGRTLELAGPPVERASGDSDMVELVREMNEGQVNTLIIADANPAYDYFASREFKKGLARVELKVSTSAYFDETSSLMDYVCPRSHFLETWEDAEPAPGIFSLNQPTIAPLFQTRSWPESLMRWSGDSRKYYDALRDR